MKQYLRFADYALWLAIIVLQCVVFLSALRRGLGKCLPRFTGYIGFVSVRSLVLFAVSQFLVYRIYFWAFYAGVALEVVLLFFVIYEIFQGSFQPLESVPRSAIPAICTIMSILAALAVSLAISNPASRHLPRIANLLNTLDRSSDIIIACALWTIVMYARHLGIPWRSRVAGIARGLLIGISIQAITVMAIGFVKFQAGMWFSRIGMVGNIAALVIWLRAVRAQEIPIVLPAPEVLTKLQMVVGEMRSGVLAMKKQPRRAAQVHSTE